MDPLAAAALLTAVTTLTLGILAEIGRRRAAKTASSAERKSAAYTELEGALTEQRALIDLYRQENGRMQAEVTAAETKATASLAAHASCEANVAKLEIRLRVAEAKISELGG